MSEFSALDHAHMAHALRLAELGLYTTRPNPRVGCVIARGDVVLGTGWHQHAGTPHAEVHALRAAGTQAAGACAYVTLEPCAHTGRTPPCTEALIAAKLARVVVACGDPFPAVAGAGLARLRSAGITVQLGLMQAQARALNAGFFSRIERRRPFVRVKLATSLDGRTALANGDSKWITGAAARFDVHRQRARACAILTGIGTVLADNPRLDVRLRSQDIPEHAVPAPLKVIVDRQLRTPLQARCLETPGKVLIAHAPSARVEPADQLRERGAELMCLEAGDALGQLLHQLADRGVNEVHTEAGATLCGALLDAGYVDELLVYQAPILLGASALPLVIQAALSGVANRKMLHLLEQRWVGEDLRLRYGVTPGSRG
jgi:diaminohydroxyphosphoribosylaminopyrimidine deaminase / 5-amino-6-(5-phosphoribosylamino)uracil reductase